MMRIVLGSYSSKMGLLEWSEAKTQLDLLTSHRNPSWLVCEKELLFAVEEHEYCGKIHCYRLDFFKKCLERLSSIDTQGKYPCHILALSEKKQLWVCNYMGGPLSVFRYTNDGLLQKIADKSNSTVRFGSKPERQEMSHPHSCILASDKKGVYVADLGCDQIIYHPLQGDGVVVNNVPLGYGPRHMAFSGDGKVLFVLCELEPYLLSFRVNLEGNLQALAECKITRQNQLSQCSEICRHPTLPYLYVANRNAAYIALLRVGKNKQVELVEEFPLASENPRHIAVSPDGLYLFAALQDSDQIQVFCIISDNGFLQEHSKISFEKPAFIGFL